RPVAIKVLLPGPQEGELWRGRFEREARALARLNHPNIISVFDFGRADKYSFLVMEYVEGANLRQLLREGELTAREALAIALQLCDALQYAHDEGVVHRDIKPENILMDLTGHVKIADFGLAKIMGDTPMYATLTGSRQAMGTFRYMAPEQIDRPRQVDHRADIFSLGVVLYEMLTGEVPAGRFEAPSVVSKVDQRVDEVVMRALEREPDRRFQAVREIKRGLAGLEGSPADLEDLAGRTESASKASTASRKELFEPKGRSRLFRKEGPTQLFSTLGIPDDTNLFTLTVCLAGMAVCLFPEAMKVDGDNRMFLRVLPLGAVVFVGFLLPLISLERAKWNTDSRRFQWTRLLGAGIVGLGHMTYEVSSYGEMNESGYAYRMLHIIMALTMGIASLVFLTSGWPSLPRGLLKYAKQHAIPASLSNRFSIGIILFSIGGLLSLLMPWLEDQDGSYHMGFQTHMGMATCGALICAIALRGIFFGYGYKRVVGLVTAVCGMASIMPGVVFLDSYSGTTACVHLTIAVGFLTTTLGLVEFILGVAVQAGDDPLAGDTPAAA
ncbi:MAG: hypothetical protein ACI841_004534, partial [Planctomycetota bacterium]